MALSHLVLDYLRCGQANISLSLILPVYLPIIIGVPAHIVRWKYEYQGVACVSTNLWFQTVMSNHKKCSHILFNCNSKYQSWNYILESRFDDFNSLVQPLEKHVEVTFDQKLVATKKSGSLRHSLADKYEKLNRLSTKVVNTTVTVKSTGLGLRETAVIRDLSNWRHHFITREIIG